MKKSALLVFLILILTHCKDKNSQPEPLPEINNIVSSWKLVSSEYKRGDSTVIESSNSPSRLMSFRYDGIPLDSLDQALCCPPSSYVVNGNLFEIKQIGDPPKTNPRCAYIDCRGCPQWKLTLEGDQLTVEYCWDTKDIYERVR